MRRATAVLLVPFAMGLASCSGAGSANDGLGNNGGNGSGDPSYNNEPIAGLSIDTIYFAQTHVQTTEDPYFQLVSDRDTLVKVQVLAPGDPRSPKVEADLRVGGETRTIVLRGPSRLPATFVGDYGKVEHTGDDSFVGVIPRELVRPGLTVTIRTQKEKLEKKLTVGAPNPMKMQMWDVHYFAHDDGNYDWPDGMVEELTAKMPISSMEISRVKDIVFKELVVPARSGYPSVRVTSLDDYVAKTGASHFDGEVAIGRKFQSALTRANGLGDVGLHWLNIFGVNADGEGGSFGGVTNFAKGGVFLHEMGHAFGLGHNKSTDYPYRGTLYGIAPPPDGDPNEPPEMMPHVGPVWAFDLASMRFLPPVDQAHLKETGEKRYKKDPMRGGGAGDQEEPFFFRHFSDYNVQRMYDFVATKLAVKQDDGEYYKWNQDDEAYTILASTAANVGITYPLEEGVEVYSLMAACFLGPGYKGIDTVYPPIGPYVGNLMLRFDPTDPTDRAEAIERGFVPPEGCDFTLKVVQGGKTSYYMLPVSGSAADDPLSYDDLRTAAVNVPAKDGVITVVSLLNTPDAEKNGLPDAPEVLATLVNPFKPVVFNEAPVDFFEDFEKGRGVNYDATEWTELELYGAPGDIYTEEGGALVWSNLVPERRNKHLTLNKVAVHNDDAVISVDTSALDAAGNRSVYFFYIDEYNNFQLFFDNWDSFLYRVQGGHYTLLGSGGPVGKNTLAITVKPSGDIAITFEGKPLITAKVEGGFPWKGGRVALGAQERQAKWDNFSVSSK